MSEVKPMELYQCSWCKRLSQKMSDNGYCQKCFEAKLATFIPKSAYDKAIEALKDVRESLSCDCHLIRASIDIGMDLCPKCTVNERLKELGEV